MTISWKFSIIWRTDSSSPLFGYSCSRSTFFVHQLSIAYFSSHATCTNATTFCLLVTTGFLASFAMWMMEMERGEGRCRARWRSEGRWSWCPPLTREGKRRNLVEREESMALVIFRSEENFLYLSISGRRKRRALFFLKNKVPFLFFY